LLNERTLLLNVLGQAYKAIIQLAVPFVPIVSARFGVELTLKVKCSEPLCE